MLLFLPESRSIVEFRPALAESLAARLESRLARAIVATFTMIALTALAPRRL
jgi:hypothetical protein